MNKLFTKIAGLVLGLAMAAGVGVGISSGKVGSAKALTATFNASDFSGGTSGSGSPISSTVSGFTMTLSKGYKGSTNSYAQNYAGGYIQISQTGYSITAVTIQASEKYTGAQDSGKYTINTGGGSASVSGTVVSITGCSGATVKFTHSKQLRFTSISITYSSQAASKYTIKYNLNGGSSSSAFEDDECDTTKAFTLKSISSVTPPTGKEFDYWSDADSNHYEDQYEIPANTYKNGDTLSLTAQWKDKTLINTTGYTDGGSYYITDGTYYLKSNGSSKPTSVDSSANATLFVINLVDDNQFTIRYGTSYLFNSSNTDVKVGTTECSWKFESSDNGFFHLKGSKISRYLSRFSKDGTFRAYAALDQSGANFELKLVPPSFSVTYNGNGKTSGDVPTDSNSYSSGATVTVLGANTLERTSYNFNGWNTQSNGQGTSYAVGATFSITQNTTLYAVWVLKQLGSISIKQSDPEPKTSYYQGDKFEKPVVLGRYEGGGDAGDVTQYCAFTGYDMDTVGQQTVIVTYNNSSVTTSYQITVNADSLLSITLGGTVTGSVANGWDLSGVTATGTYSSGSKSISSFTPETSTPAPTTGGTYSVSVTVTIGEVVGSKTYENVVVAKGQTVTDPLTVAEALTKTEGKYYVKGIISKVSSGTYSSTYQNKTFWITDSGIHPEADTGAFEFYRAKWAGGAGMTEEQFNSLVVGSTVVGYGTIKVYNSQVEFDTGCTVEQFTAPILHHISVTTQPTKTIYSAGENFDSTGMVVQKYYLDGGAGTTLASDAYTITNGTSLTVGQTSVTVSYTESSVTRTTNVEITVNQVVTDWTFKSLDFVAGETAITVYHKGSTFNNAGYTLTLVEHSDTLGQDRETPIAFDDAQLGGFDNTKYGSQSIYYTYNSHDSNTISVQVIGIDDFDFTSITGFSTWGSYAKHTVEYSTQNATVTFLASSKQSNTITNMPVSKGDSGSGMYTFTYSDDCEKTIRGIYLEFQQWSSKAQTITIDYSTDNGESYSQVTGVSSTTFSIGSSTAFVSMPDDTNAIRVHGSKTDNQIGLKAAHIEYELPEAEITLSSSTLTMVQNATDNTITYDCTNYYEAPTLTADWDDTVTLPEGSVTFNDGKIQIASGSATTEEPIEITIKDTNNMASATLSLSIIENQLDHLRVASQPTKDQSTYCVTDKLDLDGLEVYAVNKDESEELITPTFKIDDTEIDPENYVFGATGTYNIAVSYQGLTKDASGNDVVIVATVSELPAKTDIIDAELTGTGGNYEAWSGKKYSFEGVPGSYAVYCGTTLKTGEGYIQINPSKSSYIANSYSGGKLLSITANLANSYSLDVYVADEPMDFDNYSAVGELVSTKTREDNVETFTIDGDYGYFFATCHTSNAIKIIDLEIVWDTRTGVQPYVTGIEATAGVTQYYAGQTFDSTDSKVTASYSDGTSKDVTTSAIFDSNPLSQGQNVNVPVSYTEDEIEVNCNVVVQVGVASLVKDKSSGISFQDRKNVFIVGETFEFGEGSSLTAELSDGTYRDLTESSAGVQIRMSKSADIRAAQWDNPEYYDVITASTVMTAAMDGRKVRVYYTDPVSKVVGYSQAATVSVFNEVTGLMKDSSGNYSAYADDYFKLGITAPTGFELTSVVCSNEDIVIDNNEVLTPDETSTGNIITITYTEIESSTKALVTRTQTIEFDVINPEGLDEAKSFISDFFGKDLCDGGQTQPYDEEDWEIIELEYNGLSAEAKEFLVNAQYNPDFSAATGTHSEIAAGMSKYDYIVAKYKLNGFITRSVTSSANVISPTTNIKVDNSVIFIVISSMIAVSAVGGYFFIRRRKEN